MACALRLDNRRVSGEHALLFWTERRGWRIRDLGSRNGTFIDGELLPPGQRRGLVPGARLAVADEVFVFEDDLPPAAVARHADGTTLVARDGLLAVPDEENPKAVIFDDPIHGWVAEIDGVPRLVVDQTIVEVDEAPWVLGLPPHQEAVSLTSTVEADRASLRLRSIEKLVFTVTRDEEHVELTLRHGVLAIEVPSRAHHYMLLTLARAVLEDAELPPAERGWRGVEALCRMLRIDHLKLNSEVFRARRQLAGLGLADAGSLIERRADSHQLRLGVLRVEVELI
ncbi:MAG: FHA domain-containing protein [Myxococcales bacterium]|nr:FHA domain-containing protein [Myxococcales bacterium]